MKITSFNKVDFIGLVIICGLGSAIYLFADQRREGISAVGVSNLSDAPKAKPQVIANEELISAFIRQKEHNLASLVLQKAAWSKDGFGSIVIAAFKVKNYGLFDAKDLTFECKFYGKSGTFIEKTRKIVYDVLPRLSTKSFKQVSMGFVDRQADGARCEIADFEYDLEEMRRQALRSNRPGEIRAP